MPLALSLGFQPVFIYGSLGICAVIAVARLLLGWAMHSS
jgi:hypothetical protein